MNNIHWAAFWIGLFTFLSIWVYVSNAYPSAMDQARLKCVKNNGIPIIDWSDEMTGCKIYKK